MGLLLVEIVCCLGFFLFNSCLVSPAICSNMSSTVLHWSWLVRDLRLVEIGEYSVFFSQNQSCFLNESSHTIVKVHALSGNLDVTFGISPLWGLLYLWLSEVVLCDGLLFLCL